MTHHASLSLCVLSSTWLQVVPLAPHHAGGYRSVVIGSNHMELDCQHPNQHILNDVTCQR